MTERIIQVLLVEDNATDALIVREELSQTKGGLFVVTQAERLSEALELMKARAFDLVLLDLSLPDSDGLATFGRVQEADSNIPIIVLSGLEDGAMAFQAVQAGAQDYLVKGDLEERVLPRAIRYAIERKRTVQALRLTHEQLRLSLDHSPAVLYAWKLEGERMTPRLISENIASLLGIKASETMGADWWAAQVHGADRERASASIGETMSQGMSQVQYRLRHVDGNYRWVEDNRRLIRDDSGRPAELVGVWTDVTERRQTQDALATREREFRALADSVPQLVWKCRPDGWNVYFNQRWVDYTGLTLEESYGDGWVKPFHPAERLRAAEAWKNATEKGAEYSVECRLRDREGRYRWFLIRAVAQRNDAGAILWWFGTCTDIEEQKKTEEALRLLSSAVEQSKESILITDAELDLPGPKIVFVNPAFTTMSGYSAEEALGKTPRILQGPRTDKGMLGRLRQNLERGEVFQGEGVNYRKDGTEFEVEWQIAPIRDASHKTTHFVAIQRDVTVRKRADLAFEEANRHLREASRLAGRAEVATSVLHNVGNVLNSVNVSCSIIAERVGTSRVSSVARTAELLREHEGDLAVFLTTDPRGQKLPHFFGVMAGRLAEEQKALAEEIQLLSQNIEHIKNIIAVQQGYAKSVSGFRETLSVADLVEDALRMDRGGLTRHRIEVVREYGEAPPVSMEKHKVLQILVNLVSNAKQALSGAVREDKRLLLRISRANGHISVSVKDNGIGIEPENITRIFAHGFTTKKDGHGFGLHSGALAAQEMGGSLTAQSNGPGEGATFTLTLPLEMKG